MPSPYEGPPVKEVKALFVFPSGKLGLDWIGVNAIEVPLINHIDEEGREPWFEPSNDHGGIVKMYFDYSDEPEGSENHLAWKISPDYYNCGLYLFCGLADEEEELVDIPLSFVEYVAKLWVESFRAGSLP